MTDYEEIGRVVHRVMSCNDLGRQNFRNLVQAVNSSVMAEGKPRILDHAIWRALRAFGQIRIVKNLYGDSGYEADTCTHPECIIRRIHAL